MDFLNHPRFLCVFSLSYLFFFFFFFFVCRPQVALRHLCTECFRFYHQNSFAEHQFSFLDPNPPPTLHFASRSARAPEPPPLVTPFPPELGIWRVWPDRRWTWAAVPHAFCLLPPICRRLDVDVVRSVFFQGWVFWLKSCKVILLLPGL